MPISHKTKVAVLRGGPSREYEVSLNSGAAVIDALDKEKYDPVDVFIDRNGAWHVGGIVQNPSKALFGSDVVFNSLHGEYGEDGKVQMVLESLGIPYTGSGVIPSSIAMNKVLTKKALVDSDIHLAHHKILERNDFLANKPHELFKVIPHPSVIKPVGSGSSVGVTIVRTFFDLEPALVSAFSIADIIMIEEYIQGVEATCAVIENFRGQDVYALPPIEIIPPANDFFSYGAKYGGDSQEICPGNFSDEIKKQLESQAIFIHKTLGLSHYSRSDFIIHPKRGIYFLEVNTLPGMTTHSLFPKALGAVGSDLPEFLDHVITLARSKK